MPTNLASANQYWGRVRKKSEMYTTYLRSTKHRPRHIIRIRSRCGGGHGDRRGGAVDEDGGGGGEVEEESHVDDECQDGGHCGGCEFDCFGDW